MLYALDHSDLPFKKVPTSGGSVVPVFTPLPIPQGSASDGINVFWVSGNRLYRSLLDGTSTVVLDDGRRQPGAPARVILDDTHVYWVNTVASSSCSPDCTFIIRRVSKSGVSASTLATTSKPIRDIAIDAGHVFWTEQGTVITDGTVGSAVKKVGIATGTVTTLVDGRLNGLMPAPPPDQVAGTWQALGGVIANGTDVYFGEVDFDSYRVLRVSASGGTVTPAAEVAAAANTNNVRDMEVDASNVYWIDANSVRSVPRTGGTPASLAGTITSPVSLELSGGTLFWLETLCCAHGQKGAVRKVAVAGGAPVDVKSAIESPVSISVTSAHVFWIEGGAIGAIEGFGRIGRMEHDGSSPIHLFEGTTASTWATTSPRIGGFFDVDDTHLYFADRFTLKRVPLAGGPVERLAIGNFNIKDVATDGTDVYWLEDGPFTVVKKIAVAGGSVTTLASTTGPTQTIRLDATHVYWTEHLDRITRVAKAGGTPTPVVGPVASLTDFVVSGGNAYYAEWDMPGIRKVPVSGGTAVTVFELTLDQTRRLAAGDQHVYWIDQADVGRISKDGGSPDMIVDEEVASTSFIESAIIVSGSAVFWTEVASGIIYKATPRAP